MGITKKSEEVGSVIKTADRRKLQKGSIQVSKVSEKVPICVTEKVDAQVQTNTLTV